MKRIAHAADGVKAWRPAIAAAPVTPLLSVVVPAYNEAAVVRAFHARLNAVMQALGESWEVVYVNDGSRDETLAILRELADANPHVSLLNLTRNFGKEAATTACLAHARGEAVVLIDADLQDPPELITKMVACWRGGRDMVYAQRRERAGETWLKRVSADLFYRTMQNIGRAPLPRNVGDFRLMSRRVVEAVLSMGEYHRFMKGVFAWVGFPSEAVVYDRDPRAAGETKWNMAKLLDFALDGITSYTVVPLKMATYMGLLVAAVAMLYGGGLMIQTLAHGNAVPGYTSLMVVILFIGGVQLIALGIIGEYLGRVFNETKHRPLYLVEAYLAARDPIASVAASLGASVGDTTSIAGDDRKSRRRPRVGSQTSEAGTVTGALNPTVEYGVRARPLGTPRSAPSGAPHPLVTRARNA